MCAAYQVVGTIRMPWPVVWMYVHLRLFCCLICLLHAFPPLNQTLNLHQRFAATPLCRHRTVRRTTTDDLLMAKEKEKDLKDEIENVMTTLQEMWMPSAPDTNTIPCFLVLGPFTQVSTTK